MNEPTTTTTSVEVPAKKSLPARIWAYQPAKELLLVIASTIAVQLALGFTDLMGAIETAKSWGDLLTSAKAWAGAFSFALVVTVLKQSMAWSIARLAGTKL